MANKKNTRVDRNALWVSRADAIAATGYTAGKFEQRIRTRITQTDVRREGGRMFFRLVSVMSAFAVDQANAAKREICDDDAMMTGESSPALERFRGARADIAQMEVAGRKQSLLNVELFERLISAGFAPMEKFVGVVREKYGNGAAESFSDVLSEVRDSLASSFQEEAPE